MQEVTSTFELKSALAGRSGRVGFVPLTFDLHEGHLSLVRRAREENSTVVVSMPSRVHHGLTHSEVRYPRDGSKDRALLEAAGTDLLYDMGPFPTEGACWVDIDGLSRCWEGRRHPRHFRAVTTSVCKLFIAVCPSDVYFGEKDYQQLRVVAELAREFFPGLRVVGCQTVRESDGLALSTSNLALSPDCRKRSVGIHKALQLAQALVVAGERECTRLCRAMHEEVERNELRPDYVAVVDARTLEPLVVLDREARALITVFVGDVRLLDNAPLSPERI